MIGEIIHVGITVSNLERSIAFYKDILGLDYKGTLVMEGASTDVLFNREATSVEVAYLNGNDHIMSAPIELLAFDNYVVDKADLYKTSISEICFKVSDIEAMYEFLVANNVECLSSPQYFDFTKAGFSKSKAFYFKDPDGIILELLQIIN